MKRNKSAIVIMGLICVMFGFNSSSSVYNQNETYIQPGISVVKAANNDNVEKDNIEKDSSTSVNTMSNIEEKIALNKIIIKKEKEQIESVTYDKEDMTKLSGVTEQQMEKVLNEHGAGETMAHLSKAFVDSEKEHGVNAFIMAGIVALESGFATSRRAVEDNNLTGYEVYSDDSQGKIFSSQYNSVVQTASHLSDNYLEEGAVYYLGKSIDSVQLHYCPDEEYDKKWEIHVDNLANQFLEVYKNIYIKTNTEYETAMK